MKIAIISDIHDNFHNLVLFFKKIKNYKIEKIICLWDMVNNWIAKMLASSEIPVIAIWWNNDWERVEITKTSLSKNSNLTIWFDTFDIINIDWRNIFITHYPMLAKPMAKSWEFDAVFYGHDHTKYLEKINNCLLVNPWEISAHKTSWASFAIYDTNNNTAQIIELSNTITVKTQETRKYLDKIKKNFSKK